MATIDTRNKLEPMSETQAREALAANSYGRLAFEAERGPTIVPLNYVFVNSTIVIRTAPGSKLQFAPMTNVAFEVDEIAPDRSWGWTVIAHGFVFDITDTIDDYSLMLRNLPFLPWLAGEKHNVLAIKMHDIAGRWFGDVTRVASSATGH